MNAEPRSRRREEADPQRRASRPPRDLGGYGACGRVASLLVLLLSVSPAAFDLQAAVTNAVPSVPQGAVSDASDVLQFADGSSLHGNLQAMDVENGLKWAYPDAQVPIRFRPDNLAAIRFESSRRVAGQAKPGCRLVFANGDEVFGSLIAITPENVELETWFGGKMTASRSSLRYVTLFSKGYSILYEGPMDAEGWRMDRGPRGWRFHDGAFVASSMGILGRDFKMDGSTSFAFDLGWTGQFTLSLCLFTDAIDRFDYSTSSYIFYFGLGYIHLQRVQAGIGVTSLGQVQVPQMVGRNKGRFEIRAHKEEGTITLLLDGVMVHRWKDHGGITAKGTGAVFSAQMEGPTIRLSNIKVTDWDGMFEPEKIPETPAEDTVHLMNRDKATGVLESVQDGKVQIKAASTVLSIPLNRVTHILLAGVGDAATPEASPWEIRGHLANGGAVSFTLSKWDERQVSGESQNFGKLAFDPRSFRQIEFVRNRSRVNGVPAEPAVEDIWDFNE